MLATATPQGKSLAYLDNAASTQKPRAVLEAIEGLYTGYYSNVGRGSYWPATRASQAFEYARERLAGFIHAASAKEVVFTAGATDGINKVMQSFLRPKLQPGDNVVISEQEHHANLIPWQQACRAVGAELRVVRLLSTGDLDQEHYDSLLDDRTALVALTAVSNTLGVVNPVKEMVTAAHQHGIRVLIDAAQHVGHSPTDVQAWDADFVVFSGHKMYGPTGIGVLYGKAELLRETPPMAFGGGAIRDVGFQETLFADIPHKHEPGTPNLEGAVGLAAAIEYLQGLGMRQIHEHTEHLTQYAVMRIEGQEGASILGNPKLRAPVVSFTVEGAHPHDIAGFLAEEGIAIRAGHHCTQPLMDQLGVPGTARVSFGMYNVKEEIDLLMDVLKEVHAFFA
ncbi:MAG TPA: cysteine desulfurase CsdA [Cytophagales bacterium]|nr:cysteine desulfurase CsdA [Cytophagales bacterium]